MEISALNFKLKVILVSLVLWKSSFQLPSKHIVDHLNGKGEVDWLALDCSAFLLLGALIRRKGFNHAFLEHLVVCHFYRDDFLV